MRHLLVISLMLLTSACTSMQYGSLLSDDESDYSMVVADAIQKLRLVYLPAKSNLVLRQELRDSDLFGKELISSIRDNGYALEEFPDDGDSTFGIDFKYRLDTIDDLIYLTLYLDETTLSRAYSDYKGKLVPSGLWSRMEHGDE